MPIAFLLSPKGSLTPVGFSLIENKLINVSNLSARAKDTPNILLGNESPENFGL